MSCANCQQLERRVEQLRLEVLQTEERRSRERTRFAHLEEKQFNEFISGDSNDLRQSKELVQDLLDIINRLVEDPRKENLAAAKKQLEKYLN